MAVWRCSGGCGILISVSNFPGGNPVAKANPDKFATSYKVCPQCNAHYCDKCVKRMAGGLFRKARCSCGAVLS